MGLDYFIFYTEANVVCILILALMLINDRIHSTQQEKQILFNRTIVAHILYFLSDMCWAAVLSGQLARTRFTVALFNLSNYILLSLMAYEWFMYMTAAEKMPFRASRRKRALCLLPMIVSVLAMVVAYISAPTFWISESNELNAWYYPMMISVPTLYLLSAFVLSVINARKTESRAEKLQYWMIGIYPLGVLKFGLIQTFILNAPLFCFGCVIMMLVFYIQHMQALVSVDALTRLNNRGQINRYMDQVRYKENAPVYALMIDIDRFKEINDSFGHAEGDRALVLVSEALKQACTRFRAPVFLGRYGGDEFIVFIQNPEEDEHPDRLLEAVRSILDVKRRENNLLYDLKISAGYDSLQDKDDTLHACVVRADEKLYEEKRQKGTMR